MIKYLFLFFFSLNTLASDTKDAQEAAKALFPFIFKDSKSLIKTKDCKIQKDKWAMLLVTKQSFIETFKYSKDCDLKGSFEVAIDKFFPIKLEIKDQPKYKSITSNIKMWLTMNAEPELNIELRDAHLKGTKDVKFHLDYSAIIEPFNSKNIIKKQTKFDLKLKK